MYAFMSNKSAKDYAKVLKVAETFTTRGAVVRCTIDFEKGMWKAVRELFPGILVKGCFFHYAQACMRHIEEEGLKKAYCSNDATHKLLKKVIVLPLMHHEDIPRIFMELKSKVGANSPLLSNFFQYVEINWIASTTWPPINWSVFGCSIRTNNDVEGWHNKIRQTSRISNTWRFVVYIFKISINCMNSY